MKPLTLAEYKARGIRLKAGDPVLCGYCSKPFPYVPKNHRQAYCPDGDCRRLAHIESKRVKLEPRECIICGKEFVPEHPRYKACPGECRMVRDRTRNKHPREPKPELTPDEAIRRRELSRYESQLREGTGRTAILADLLKEYVDRIPASEIKPYKYKPRSKRDSETMVVLRSDFHPGIITPSYNLEVFHRRMELFTEKVILIRDIISETIPLERMVIFDLGDLISGQGIFPNQAWKSEKNVMEQIYHEASPAIIRQNRTWLDYFPRIDEYSVPGNHGRTGKEYPEEANFDNILAQEIDARMEFIDRHSMTIEWDWYQYVDVYGWRFLTMHGNQLVGYKNIPFYNIITKGMRWQGSMPEGHYDYLVHGHWHVPFTLPWNDFEAIGNGTTVSNDDFGLKVLGMSSTPAQQVFGVHPEHGVTWRYTLDLS